MFFLSAFYHRCRVSLLLSAVLAACTPAAQAAETPAPAAKPDERPGDWVPLHKDGTPWKHEGTDLRFPQSLGGFSLRTIFKDKRAGAGIDLRYVNEKDAMKADVVVFPCSEDLGKVTDVMAFVHGEHEKLVSDLQAVSKGQGYAEVKHGTIEDRGLRTWQGDVPMTVQTFEFGPVDPSQAAAHPNISQWLGLVLYQDHFVQMSIVRPAASGTEGEKLRDELIKLLLRCVREPSVVPEMLKLCKTYVDRPLTKEGRDAADNVLAFSRDSPVFRVIYPGEVLTPALDEVSAVSKDTGLDLLRSFIVGSGVVALQNGTADQSLEEGGRLMAQMYNLAKKDNPKISSALLEELSKAEEKERGAVFLRTKMAEKPAGK